MKFDRQDIRINPAIVLEFKFDFGPSLTDPTVWSGLQSDVRQILVDASTQARLDAGINQMLRHIFYLVLAIMVEVIDET